MADLPKRVKWDQQRLKEVVELIRSGWGEDPADYVKVKFEVSERAYEAWPRAAEGALHAGAHRRDGEAQLRAHPARLREARMSLRLVTAEMRLSAAIAKTTMCHPGSERRRQDLSR